MTVPSGSAVTADFRCSTLVTGTAMTVYPSGSQIRRNSAMPAALVRRVRPT